MSAVVVSPFSKNDLAMVEEIFFESSTKKTFESDEEKRQFQWKYLGTYLKNFPELFLVAKKDGKILGYIAGATRSDFDLQPHMKAFEDVLTIFPSHYHINCHAESRGLGVGSLLVLSLEKKLQALKFTGVHIMTGAESQNRSFYQKLGYTFEEKREFQGRFILMMGKPLTGLVNNI
jgi:ribosomal protein S18 acetylase RimI-like enzyme